MCVRQQSLMQLVRDGDGDTVSCSTDTSRWSSHPGSCCGSVSPQDHCDGEDKVDLFLDSTPHTMSTDKREESKHPRRKKVQRAHKQKTMSTGNHQILKLPSIKYLQVSKPRIQSASLNCIRDLKSQVWDLQQQLSEARMENKLLKRLQHRHTVALQHFQDSEDSISQILTKHNNETRVLQGLLREARACRDNLARQLQATEKKLLNTNTTLQHLQQLSQDHSLLEREELTLRLAQATAELQEKGKRILDMEKNLELCQASFNRQIVTEGRKISDARKISSCLQEHIYELTKEIQDREKEREKQNIYSRRFLNGSIKKGRENKMVQTDGFILLPTDAARTPEPEYSETEESPVNWFSCNKVLESLVIEKPETDVSAGVTSVEIHQEDTESCADTCEENSISEESPEHRNQRPCAKQTEEPEAPQVIEEQQKTEHESGVTYILEKSLNAAEPKKKDNKLPKFRRNYTFKQSTENLHNGRPAYSTVDIGLCGSTKSTMKVEVHSSEIQDLCLPGDPGEVE